MSWQTKTIGTESAKLDYKENYTPYSAHFDDIYFSKKSGLEESNYVFVSKHNFPERWQEDSSSFNILELGFGTGLNFLLTWKLWQESQKKVKKLHYISCEAFPLNKKQLQDSHNSFPELKSYSEELIKNLPAAVCGFQRIPFLKDNLELTLLYGDAKETLKQLHASIDAFYLDGFAPKKNPELWSSSIFEEVKRLAAINSTLSSFSSASDVRKNLEQNDFKVKKIAGYGDKREMITASTVETQYFASLENESDRRSVETQNIASLRNQKACSAKHEVRSRAIVIGAGLAGCSAAFAFLRRGIDVHLIEEKAEIAQMSSGNLSAVLMPHISASPDLRTRFSFSGFNFSNSLINNLEALGKNCGYQNSGVLRIANSKRLETVVIRLDELKIDKQTAEFVDKELASEILGIEINSGALYYPNGGFLNSAKFCAAMLSISTNLKTSFLTKAQKIKREDNQWAVYDSENKLIDSAQIVVIANANSSLTLEQTAWLPLEPVRGQVAHLPENAQTKSLKSVLCYEGYIVPAVDGLHLLGATYEHEKDDAPVSIEKTNDLISRLNQYLDKFKIQTQETLAGRVGFRSSTPDRMPIIGMLNNTEKIEENYQAVKYRDFNFFDQPQVWHEGLYVSLGHGSQGVISCPIAGELIASQACGEPLPLDEDLVRFTNPLRFQVRELNRE